MKSKEQVQLGLKLSSQTNEVLWECIFHDDLCSLLLTSGDFGGAIKESESTRDLAVEVDDFNFQRIALWKKGLAYIGMNSIEKAQEAADELKEFIEKGINKKAIKLYHHLQGRIELEKNNYSLSIGYLDKVISSLFAQTERYIYRRKISFFDALFYDTLALAYLNSGDLENAQKQYETIISLTWGRYYWGNIYAKSYYNLGKLHEQQGNIAKAKEHYETFLDLWKDADPGLPEVEDAKKRLLSLKSW